MITIRRAVEEDFERLPDIEMDAGYELSLYGLQTVAQMPAVPPGYYKNLPNGSTVFVACDESSVVGFAVCQPVDGEAHLKEVSVLRAYMKRGIGKRLIDTSINWAIESGFRLLTLTTYRDIIFNAPFYKTLGFVPFEPDGNWPELCVIREKEKACGLDIKPRISMMLSLSSST